METGASSGSTSRTTTTDSSLSASDIGIVNSSSSLIQTSDGSESRAQSYGQARIGPRPIYREMEQECWSCLVIPITFWFFTSMTLILGFYGSENLLVGPNTSQILNADSLLVNEIEVQDNQEPGPMLYGFSTQPELNVERNWSDYHKITLQADYHQEWPIWLNRGSNVSLNYTVWSTGFFDILIAAVKGSSGLHRWISDPMNPNLASSWHTVHGAGVLTFEADEDADYYFALGNLNHHDIEVQLELSVHAMLYNTSNADYQCSLHSKLCGVHFFFPGSNFALLTTPDVRLGKHKFWYIKLSYGQRWVTYIFSLGAILSLIVLLLRITKKLHSHSRGSTTSQQMPLLSHKEGTGTPGSYGTIHQDYITRLYHLQFEASDGDETGSKSDNLYDSRTCAVCYDAPRTSFFDPCGHCVTCYTCGLRIQIGEIGDSDTMGDHGTCPICRTSIQQVRKIYTA